MNVADKMTIIAALRAQENHHLKRAGKYRNTAPALCETHLAEYNRIAELIARLEAEES